MVRSALLTLLVQSVVQMELDKRFLRCMDVAMYPADEILRLLCETEDWETLCFTEYVGDCSVPLPCRLDRRRLYSNRTWVSETQSGVPIGICRYFRCRLM